MSGQLEIDFKADHPIILGKILKSVISANETVHRSHAGAAARLRRTGVSQFIEMEGGWNSNFQ